MKTKTRKTGWQAKQDKLAKSLIGNYRVVDAKVAFRATVLPQDIKNSQRKNPAHCALARAIGRQTGMDRGIAVFHHVAYAPFDKKGDGNITIERFRPTSETQRSIEEFDKTGKFVPGEYVSKPVPPSMRFNAAPPKHDAAKYKRKSRSNWKAKPRVSMLGVRNGTGSTKGINHV